MPRGKARSLGGLGEGGEAARRRSSEAARCHTEVTIRPRLPGREEVPSTQVLQVSNQAVPRQTGSSVSPPSNPPQEGFLLLVFRERGTCRGSTQPCLELPAARAGTSEFQPPYNPFAQIQA